jgi:hypothetical protein
LASGFFAAGFRVRAGFFVSVLASGLESCPRKTKPITGDEVAASEMGFGSLTGRLRACLRGFSSFGSSESALSAKFAAFGFSTATAGSAFLDRRLGLLSVASIGSDAASTASSFFFLGMKMEILGDPLPHT